MNAFTGKKFSATLDSKGRITVPAEVRRTLGLEQGDKLALELPDIQVQKYSVSDQEEALEILQELEDVREFSFDGKILEVVVNG